MKYIHRLQERSAAMIDVRAVLGSVIGCLLLAGCGSSTDAPVPTRKAVNPDVIVTLDEERHTCLVALASEAQGSAVPCDDVVPFVREQLRLPSGSIYDIRAISKGDGVEMAKVETRLKGAGYRFIGDSH
jgi:hypothetical protein